MYIKNNFVQYIIPLYDFLIFVSIQELVVLFNVSRETWFYIFIKIPFPCL